MAVNRAKILRLRTAAIREHIWDGLIAYERFERENGKILAALHWVHQKPELAAEYERCNDSLTSAHHAWLRDVRRSVLPLVAHSKRRLRLVDDIERRELKRMGVHVEETV